MPADLQKANQIKERIISLIKIKGPSLPVQIARSLNLEPLFASAFLSELKSEQKITTSNMKVGSSPLYLVPGQENLLENFTQYLNSREKEALSLLKEKSTLSDEDQTPIVRVALRAIKDFAIPLRIRINEDSKIFWKHFLLSDKEAQPLISAQVTGSPSPTPIPAQSEKQEPVPAPTQTPQTSTPPIEAQPKQPKPKKPKKVPDLTFPNNIKEYLSAKDIELLSLISEKKRELEALVRTDTLFGKQSHYLIAKDKKSITDNDLTLALQKAQTQKMPALLISPGTPNKKALAYLQLWSNLIKFEKTNF
tara:strand:- start:1454 stop:2374 length:921 start_codon:yes stop_codon:yes gene_type:complete